MGIPVPFSRIIIKYTPCKWLTGKAYKGLKALFIKEKKPHLVTVPPVPTIVSHGTTIVNPETVNYYSQPPQ